MIARVIHELLGALAKSNLSLGASPVQPNDLGELIDAVARGRLTGESKVTLGSRPATDLAVQVRTARRYCASS